MWAVTDKRRDSTKVAVPSLLAAGVILVVTLGALPIHGRELYPGQYANVDPAERQWFRSQKNPITKLPCCDEADGTYAEEEIRDGHYWTRFTWRFCFAKECQELDSGWMEVPENAVLHDPNPHGMPVVWWVRRTGTDAATARAGIRCYSPGAKS